MIFLLAFAMASCSEEIHDSPALNGSAELRILPQVTGTVQAKAAVAGASFASGAQVGLRLASSVQTLNGMYNNFYASYNGTDWRYFLNGTNTGTRLSGFSNWGTVTVMGYYPYNGDVTDFSAIPFRIAGDDGVSTRDEATTDYMVAGTKTKQMATGAGTVTLEFEHLMTYVYLYLTRTYQGPALTLHKVTLEIDNRDFVVAGTYKANNPDMSNISGLITPLKTTTKLEITINQTISTGAGAIATVPLVIMPELAAAGGDATVTVTLYFNDADGLPFYFDDHNRDNPVMTFSLSSVDSGSGFLRGKQYRLSATLGTFVHFNGVPVVEDRPIDGNTDDEHIEI